MTDDTSSRRTWKWTTVTWIMLVALATYMGCYYWLVRLDVLKYQAATTGGLITRPLYQGYQLTDLVFAPAHWLDKKLRPETWQYGSAP